MAKIQGIVADLDACVGCYACEVACKQENNVPIGERWINVITVGPEKLNGCLQMDFIPIMTDACTLCQHRQNQDLEPLCVTICPTQALKSCQNTKELLSQLHSGKRLHICKIQGDMVVHG